MRVFKIKSEAELRETGYYKDYAVWESRNIYRLRHLDKKEDHPDVIAYAEKINRPVSCLYYPVIDVLSPLEEDYETEYYFGRIIQNSSSEISGCLKVSYTDEQMDIIFRWAIEKEITPKENPEYFL